MLKRSEAPQAAGGWVSRAKTPRIAVAEAQGVLLDWDGCVALGNRPQPAALDLLVQCRGRVAIVSNNSSNLPEDFTAILAQAGVELPPSRILLAGVEALARAAEMGARRVLVLGDGRMRAHARRLGLSLVRDDADLVVLLRDTRFSYARLEAAANSLKAGARLVVANPDLTHPGPQGRIAPETGALLAALTACLPEPPQMEVIGKPAPRLFQRAVEILGSDPARTVMIGDNPSTDIEGAAAFGLQGVWIGPAAGLPLSELVDPAGALYRAPPKTRLRTA
jgi:4-nitrophenyl phosphatase